MRKTILAISALVLLAACSAPPATNTGTAAAGCDRECLKGFVNQYLDAITAHNPAALPVTANVKFTENNEEMKLGEGLWQTFTRPTAYRRDILDVKQGVAVSFLVAEGEETPMLYVIRLKIEDKKVSEIETMSVRNKEEGMLYNPENLQTVVPLMLTEVPENQKTSREEAINAALTYPAGLKIGSFVKVDSPMAQEAYRYENGQLMAGPGWTFFPGCDVMKTQAIPTLSEITHRVIAVDEELGVVAMRMNFGKGSLFSGQGVLDVWHSFKIYDGLIHAAEAYCKAVPAGAQSGWGWD
ncbi:MAG: lipoprotein [Acidobacteriota bacterium]|jgi:hypothetical protein|nr:lipoprotein [Acidobacteriota bacterium]